MKVAVVGVLLILLAVGGYFLWKSRHAEDRAAKRQAGYRELSLGGVSLGQSRGEAEAKVGVPDPGSMKAISQYTTPQGKVQVVFANDDVAHAVESEAAELRGQSVRKGDPRSRVLEVFGAPARENPGSDIFSAPYWVLTVAYDSQGAVSRFKMERQDAPADEEEARERQSQIDALERRNQERIKQVRGY